ncbi:hypothetical protein F5Y12DRAFT_776450 [Xylaria sp. FL1777]|nr:hypothetical protein F5Y12DRAFT_776450 [Xylaria sp. FL1777]
MPKESKNKQKSRESKRQDESSSHSRPSKSRSSRSGVNRQGSKASESIPTTPVRRRTRSNSGVVYVGDFSGPCQSPPRHLAFRETSVPFEPPPLPPIRAYLSPHLTPYTKGKPRVDMHTLASDTYDHAAEWIKDVYNSGERLSACPAYLSRCWFQKAPKPFRSKRQLLTLIPIAAKSAETYYCPNCKKSLPGVAFSNNMLETMIGVVCNICTTSYAGRTPVEGAGICSTGCARLLPIEEFFNDGLFSTTCDTCRREGIPLFQLVPSSHYFPHLAGFEPHCP